jgi:exodeoxyribonuclease-5
MGDTAQLPPVLLTNSPALNPTYLDKFQISLNHVHLTTVARQNQDSGILFNATRIRYALQHNQIENFPKFRLNLFPDIKKVPGSELIEAITNAYDRTGIDETIVICRSNKRAAIYNNGIRSRILCREDEISTGDRLMVVKNNYSVTGLPDDTEFIANGEIFEVRRVRKRAEMFDFHFCDVHVRFLNDDSEAELKLLADTLQTDTPALPKVLSDKLFHSVYACYADEKFKGAIMKKVKVDPYYNAVQVKYAYAVTCHKAQGGQWENVFLDIGNITQDMLGEDFYRWLYTAITRATKQLFLVNLPQDFEEKITEK